MRVPRVVWAFFALAALAFLWNVLNHGILLGAEVRQISRPYGEAYIHVCRYLYIGGIREAVYPEIVIATREEAELADCPSSPKSN
jgi:hypothetical protein